MATFPAGIYAPVAKAAGNTIQASFFNDPEAEIIAIETELKSAITFPVTMSSGLTISAGGLTVSTGSVNVGGPSSLATLQVNGGSTFVGPMVASSGLTISTGGLRVAGNSSFADPVTFNAAVTFAVPQQIVTPSVSVALGTNFALSSAAELCPDWLVETWDNVAAHSTAVNSSRLTFTDSTGLYEVGFTGAFTIANAASPMIRARIRFNDTSAGPMATVIAPSSAAFIGVTCIGRLRVQSTTDYVTARLAFTVSSGATLLAASTLGQTAFWYSKVSV